MEKHAETLPGGYSLRRDGLDQCGVMCFYKTSHMSPDMDLGLGIDKEIALLDGLFGKTKQKNRIAFDPISLGAIIKRTCCRVILM